MYYFHGKYSKEGWFVHVSWSFSWHSKEFSIEDMWAALAKEVGMEIEFHVHNVCRFTNGYTGEYTDWKGLIELTEGESR